MNFEIKQQATNLAEVQLTLAQQICATRMQLKTAVEEMTASASTDQSSWRTIELSEHSFGFLSILGMLSIRIFAVIFSISVLLQSLLQDKHLLKSLQ